MYKKIVLASLLTVCQCFAVHHENDDRPVNKIPKLRFVKDLNASASGQFSEDQFALILGEIVQRHNVHPSNIVVVDLREEAHFYANGVPFTVTDRHENPSKKYQSDNEAKIKQVLENSKSFMIMPRKLDEIKLEARKAKHAERLKKGLPAKHDKHKRKLKAPVLMENPIIRTEAELAKHYGVQYWRLPLTDHYPPDLDYINSFINFVQNLPKGTWIHLHCRGGNGRATSFMAILDMLQHNNRSFDEILDRQHKVGGKDLKELPDRPERHQANHDRVKVLKDVYNQIRS